MNVDDRGDAGLADLAAFARRRLAWIAVPAIAVAVIAGLLSSTRTSTYEAKARLAVQPPSTASDTERALFGDTDLPSQLSLIQSAPVLSDVLREANLPSDDRAVRQFQSRQLEVRQHEGSPSFDITVRSPDPRRAAALAQGVADQYLRYLDREAAKRLARAVRELRANDVATRQQIRSLEAQVASGPGKTGRSLEEERDELYAQLRFSAARVTELQTARALARLGYVVEPATVPEAPSSPRPLRDALLAIVVGGFLGLGLAFIRDRTDTSVAEPAEVTRAGAGPLLGTVQVPAGGGAADIEALRAVRTSLLALCEQCPSAHGIALLPVAVSAGRDEGTATALTVGLAQSLSRTGRQVVLVDADVSAATPHALLERGAPGVRELLAGTARDPGMLMHQAGHGLQVLPAGERLEEAADLLGGPRFRELLQRLAASTDHVILVVPALAAGAVAVDVAVAAGGVVLLAPSGISSVKLSEAAARLTAVGARPMGTVLWSRGRRRPLSRPGGEAATRLPDGRQLVP